MSMFLDDGLQHEATGALAKAKAVAGKVGDVADVVHELAVMLLHAIKFAAAHWEWILGAVALFYAAKAVDGAVRFALNLRDLCARRGK